MDNTTQVLSAGDAIRRPTGTKPVSRLARGARVLYLLCAITYFVFIIMQVFFAGAGVLVDPAYFVTHTTLGHLISLVTYLLVIVGLFARLPGRIHAFNVLTIFLYMLQYVFLWAVPNMGVPVLRALHAVNALAMFWLGMYLIQFTWQLMRGQGRHNVEPAISQGVHT